MKTLPTTIALTATTGMMVLDVQGKQMLSFVPDPDQRYKPELIIHDLNPEYIFGNLTDTEGKLTIHKLIKE